MATIFNPDVRQRVIAAVQGQGDMAPMPLPTIAPFTMGSPSLPPIAPPVARNVSGPIPGTIQGDQLELRRLQSTGSGASQIANPVVHGIARFGDVLSSIAGAVDPYAHAVLSQTPGTTLHHNLLVGEQEQRLAQDRAAAQADVAVGQTQAVTRHLNAESQGLENPTQSFTPVQTDEGLAAFNPATGKGSLMDDGHGGVLAAPSKTAPPHYVTQDDGTIVSIAPDANGQPKATLVYQGNPKVETEVTKLEVGGKPHSVIVNKKTGETIKDLGETGEKPPSVSVSSGTYSLASLPDGKGGTKPVLLNNKTGEVKDAPEGLSKAPAVAAGAAPSMTVADKNRASLAKIAMANLDQVQDIVNRRPDLLGKMGLVKSTADLLGSNDPDLVALGNEVHNFAMANAGIHGSRSFQNVQAAEQELLGHFKNGAPGIQGGITANRKNLQTIIEPNAAPSQAVKRFNVATGRLE